MHNALHMFSLPISHSSFSALHTLLPSHSICLFQTPSHSFAGISICFVISVCQLSTKQLNMNVRLVSCFIFLFLSYYFFFFYFHSVSIEFQHLNAKTNENNNSNAHKNMVFMPFIKIFPAKFRHISNIYRAQIARNTEKYSCYSDKLAMSAEAIRAFQMIFGCHFCIYRTYLTSAICATVSLCVTFNNAPWHSKPRR